MSSGRGYLKRVGRGRALGDEELFYSLDLRQRRAARRQPGARHQLLQQPVVCTNASQHTSEYVRIRQHTSASLSIRENTAAAAEAAGCAAVWRLVYVRTCRHTASVRTSESACPQLERKSQHQRKKEAARGKGIREPKRAHEAHPLASRWPHTRVKQAQLELPYCLFEDARNRCSSLFSLLSS